MPQILGVELRHHSTFVSGSQPLETHPKEHNNERVMQLEYHVLRYPSPPAQEANEFADKLSVESSVGYRVLIFKEPLI